MFEKQSNKAYYIYNIPCTYLLILIHGTILLHLCSPESHSYTQISQSFTPPSVEIPSVLSSFTLHEGVLSIHTAVSFSITLAAAASKSLLSCPTLCDPIDSSQPTRLPRPWDSPGKNTGVGCHCLLHSITLSGCQFTLKTAKPPTKKQNLS